jgi:hypothetical protein
MLVLGRIFSNDRAKTYIETSLMGKVFIIVQVILECNDSANTRSFTSAVKLKGRGRCASIEVKFRWGSLNIWFLNLWFHRVIVFALFFALFFALIMA